MKTDRRPPTADRRLPSAVCRLPSAVCRFTALEGLDVSEDKGSSGLGRAYRQVGPYLSIGVEFTATILLCLGVGWWIDERFHTAPAFTLVGVFFGMAAAFYNLLRTVIGIQKRDRKGPKPGGDG